MHAHALCTKPYLLLPFKGLGTRLVCMLYMYTGKWKGKFHLWETLRPAIHVCIDLMSLPLCIFSARITDFFQFVVKLWRVIILPYTLAIIICIMLLLPSAIGTTLIVTLIGLPCCGYYVYNLINLSTRSSSSSIAAKY